MLPSKWAKLCKSTVNSSIVSFICGTTWKFSLVHPGLTSLSPPALFPLQSECNQLWHEKTRSLSVRTRASLPLTVLCWLSSTSPKTASLSLPLHLPHILCAYEHQNAIRPSKTPLVPWLAGPRTVVVHSEPSERRLLLTTGPLLQPLWKINPKKSHSWGKILGSERRIEQLGQITPSEIQ